MASAALAASALFGAGSALAAEKVEICHSTGATGNPYVLISPSIDSEGGLNGDHTIHTGGLFDFSDPDSNEGWGDIIPPYEFEGGSFAGMNWPEGQAILKAGCAEPPPPPPPADPGIDVAKSADPENLDSGGGSVTYTYVVTNAGNVALSDVTIADDKCAEITGPTSDKNDDELLDVDETWTYECTMEITETTTNIVAVEGTAGEDTVSATDEATVTVDQALPATGTPSPKPSLPSTSTIDEPSQGGGGAAVMLLLLLLAAGAAGLVILDPASIRIRK